MTNPVYAEIFITLAKQADKFTEANNIAIGIARDRSRTRKTWDVITEIVDLQVQNALLYEMNMFAVTLASELKEPDRRMFWQRWTNVPEVNNRDYFRQLERMYMHSAEILEKYGYTDEWYKKNLEKRQCVKLLERKIPTKKLRRWGLCP